MTAYVVNKGGATHSVNDEDLEGLLAQGFKVASDEQIAAWYAAQGLKADGTPLKAEKAGK